MGGITVACGSKYEVKLASFLLVGEFLLQACAEARRSLRAPQCCSVSAEALASDEHEQLRGAKPSVLRVQEMCCVKQIPS